MANTPKYDNRTAISASVEQAELDLLDEIRWREHKSRTEILRLAITEYIKAHRNGNSTFKLDNWTNNPEFKAVPTVYADTANWDKYLENCSKEELKELEFRFGRCADKCKEVLSAN